MIIKSLVASSEDRSPSALMKAVTALMKAETALMKAVTALMKAVRSDERSLKPGYLRHGALAFSGDSSGAASCHVNGIQSSAWGRARARARALMRI